MNQTQAQKDWAARNQDYWKRYRQQHPAYVERNRDQQRERNDLRKLEGVAKMAPSADALSLDTGTYELRRIGCEVNANMASWIVAITVLSRGSGPPATAV
ncbi:hypothetical protein QTH90_15215 [Variovorax sp. J2P1-59]|uniref:hypothetical protein n=1 Tax=Variovorax flavidus TaxID=3053501 RepID=UPI00257640FC|nr:hypothetical protein [Variovorax sp. J2P1-59]MDM0075751.1 hypothetical protein [Variovorax sp. J2P1-59]